MGMVRICYDGSLIISCFSLETLFKICYKLIHINEVPCNILKTEFTMKSLNQLSHIESKHTHTHIHMAQTMVKRKDYKITRDRFPGWWDLDFFMRGRKRQENNWNLIVYTLTSLMCKITWFLFMSSCNL